METNWSNASFIWRIDANCYIWMRNKEKCPPPLVSKTINFCCSKSLGLQYIVIGTIGIHVPCLYK